MFVLGHIGIGRAIASPWRRALPAVAFIAGTLLPDLIDKPLYYSGVFGSVTATRTVGHTGLCLLAIAAVAAIGRSRAIAAVAAGVATHMALDCLLDLTSDRPRGAWIAAAWPLLGPFPPVAIPSMTAHLHRLFVWPVIAGEVVGGGLIAREIWRTRRRIGNG